MKHLRQRRLLVVLISVLVACLVAGTITLLVLNRREQTLEEQQNEALQELYDNQGRYDEQSIVLSGTTKPRAEELAKAFGAELRITEDGRFAALTLPEGVTVFDIYENEEYRKYIEYMSLDYQAKISDLLPSDRDEDEGTNGERLPIRPQYTVNDTDYNRQTYLDYLNMSNVWSKTKGSGITVAVIDTGIDTDHPEFAGRISEYSYNASEDKIVKDYVLSNGSYDWSLVEDEQGHGTAVAGVIAASMDGSGVVGIAPQVNIIVIKAKCDENGTFERTSDLVFGLYYAIERDVAVVNMSFGVVSTEDPFAEPAQLAFDSDVICVAAAGNGATANLTWPAAGENVFGVGALAEDSWELAAYSNYGENVDFVAPGTVYTTKMGGGYGGMDGTSFASPITAGVLALYMSQNKYSELNTIEELLYASCYDLGDLGPDFYYGYGALDVSALMLEERGKVTFNMMTDELDNTEQVFIRSHTLQNMPEPERLYAIFDGWYYDPQCTDEYVWYEDEFHGDLTLYANWVNEDDGIPFTYVELDDGTIEIRSYTGHRRYITIPDYIDGKVVSSIGEFAFAGETRLREVKLPKYLKRIRMGAFSGCSNLVSMEIPDTVTEIGGSAFYDNVRLSTLIFGQNSQLESIGDLAFSGCAKMRTFTVPSKVTALNATAFFRNTSMMAFDVQKGNTAFSAKDGVLFNITGSTLVCYPAGLKGTYVVPENVKTVGTYAFACTRLSGVELSNVETLGGAAFAYGSLESIVIPDSVISMGGAVFAYNGYLHSAKLGAGLTSISEGAFLSTALTSIEIPSGIRSIDADAFANIGSLAEVAFTPNSTLMYIGANAFFDSGVKSVEMPASVVTIDEGAFGAKYFCKLISLTFEDNSALYTVGEYAFANQYQLTTVDLPDRLASLGDFAFSDTGLVTIYIPASVTYFGAGAFASCHSLENIFVEDENKNYVDVDGVVYDTAKKILVAYPAGNGRKSYKILNGVTDIGTASFYGSWNLTGVDLSSTVTTVREQAFYDCEYVTRYGMSNVLTYIQAYAFSKNYSLQTMSMPDGLMQISNFAFAGDRSLYSVTFTENAKLPRISYGAFAYCGLTSFCVPANVSTMAQGAFMGCSNLRSFTFAKNSKLESISAYMFDGCSNLRTITFEKGSALTSIQAHGLEGMRNLTSIDFGDAKLTNIDNFAFRFCESLTRFDIPEGVTFLGRYAFYYCTNLSEVTIPSTMDFIGRFAFLGTKDINVYFAAETLPANLAEDWDHGTKGYYLGVTDVITEGDWTYAKLTSGDIAIIEYTGTATDIDLTTLNLGGDIVNIGGGAFMDSTVEHIVLPSTLQIIQAEAFYHSELKSVSIPASVTFIGREAFAYTPIAELTFASNAQLKTIEQSAFEKTEKLSGVVIPASLTTMGRAVFKSSGITSLTFAEGFSMTEIPEEAFAYTHIPAVTIPDSVTLINHNAFREIKELKSVTLGSGEEMMIMSNVFYQSGLETVYIPENVCYVGEYAFVGLHDLTEFTVSENNPYYKAVDGLLASKNGRKLIAVPAGREGSLIVPEGIEVIGFGAFEDSQLSEIKFLDNANILSFGYRAFYNADGITEMHIPASVVAIDYYAFAMCDNLQTVTFAENNNLKGVYEGAFYGCKNLSDIMLPDSIVEISDFAFYGCRKLTDVPVSETTCLKGIYDYAFAYAGFSGDYTMPETLIDIGPYAFMGNKFTSVTVPDTNYWDLIIGIGAFEDCNELVEITVPFIGAFFEDDEITWFGYIFGAGGYEANATYVPESLKKVNISEGITFVGSHAFDGLTGLEEMSIPHSVQIIYSGAFTGTTALYELTNEISLMTIGYGWVGFGSGLYGHIELSSSMEEIPAYTFAHCGMLNSIAVPKSIKKISDGAFPNNKTLDIYITDLREWIELEHHDWARGNLYLNGELIEDLVIPDGVTSIPMDCFSNNKSIKSVYIPDSVEVISGGAFSECQNLHSVCLGRRITHIGSGAFRGCVNLRYIDNYSHLPLRFISNDYGGIAFYADYITDSEGTQYKGGSHIDYFIDTHDGFRFTCTNGKYILIDYFGDSDKVILPSDIQGCSYSVSWNGNDTIKELVITEGVKHISGQFFNYAKNLHSVIILGDLEQIGRGAFRYCKNLSYVSIHGAVKQVGRNAFDGCNITDVNIGNLAAWCQTEYDIFEQGNPLLKKVERLYVNGELTTDIVIPEGVSSINENAFSGCKAITSVTIPDSVHKICNETFTNCSSLKRIDLGEGVTQIEQNAFNGCSSLMTVHIPNNFTFTGGMDLFEGCSQLSSFTVSDDHPTYYAIDGVLYYKSVSVIKTIACVPKGVVSIHIPEGVWNIDRDFEGCSSLTSITLPTSLTSIGYRAFYGCSSLTSITIPDGITSIDDSAFSGCRSLTSITIPNSVTSIDLSGCSGLTSITIPNSVTSIDLSGCSGLTSITIPNRVTSIDLSGCSSLTSITIPNSVTSIDLSGCSSLTSIEIPDSVTSIVLSGCSSLTSIEIPDSVTSIGNYAFRGCSSLTSVTIGNGVMSIGSYAFSDCTGLMSIEIPDSVTSIGNYSFRRCSSLTSVTIGNGVKTIGNNAFEGCTSLTNITMPDSVTSIDRAAFSGCTSLTSITIPDGITSIGDYAFSGCSSLTSITIPDGITSIGDSAFIGCSSLTGIEIPDSVTSIGDNTFEGCTSLTSVTIPDSVTSIGRSAFSGCTSLTSITIPDSVTSIGYGAFFNCYSLTGVTLTDTVTNIGGAAFFGCSSLTGIEIPDGVTSIGDNAFEGCTSLTSVTIPDSVTSIGHCAFRFCSILTSVTIPDSVTSIGGLAFEYCSSLYVIYNNSTLSFAIGSSSHGCIAQYAKLIVDKNGNKTYQDESSDLEYVDTVEGFRFMKERGKYTLIAYLGQEDTVTLPTNIHGSSYEIYRMVGVKNVIIPDGVTSIGDNAFEGRTSLTSITIPDGITSIGDSAFSGCSSLTSITIPDSVASIGNHAFYACRSLTRVYITDISAWLHINFSFGSNPLRNGGSLFLENELVTELIIPDSVTSIGDDAFSGCSSLMSITIPVGVTSIGDDAFSGCSSLMSITIPAGVTSIGSGAFSGCSSLTSITIPDSVTSIGDNAFVGCSSLTSITIPDSVTSIGSGAFSGCSSLTSIAIPDSVTSIGSSAFSDTAYYNDSDNWEIGVLYIGNHLIEVSEEIKYMDIREGIASIADGAYEGCYLLKNAVVVANNSRVLSSVTNLETLVITEMPFHRIGAYFGYTTPLTLKSIVLGKDIQMRSDAFYGITGITIYVEANEKDVRWDENFPGWNNGNKIVYGDDWITADFYYQNGNLMSSEIFLTSQVIRQPYLELAEGLEESQVLVGWDIDGDGIPDNISATSTVDIVARPIIETRTSEYTVRFFDADGMTLISKVILPYGTVIAPPEYEEKMGYTTNGWIGYTEGMTVSGNHTFVLNRVHNGDGHDYDTSVWVAPTCTEKGYNKHICKICGEWYATDEVEAVGHDYTFAEISATCTEEGEIRYSCSACDHAYTEVIFAHGHKYVGKVTKSATCTKHGEILFICENCGDRVVEKTPMAAHNYQKKTAPKWWLQILIEMILNVFFGYEGDNIYYYECIDCKRIQTAEESPTGGSGTAGIMSAGCAHQLSDWTEYIAPTCEGEGVDAKFCAICEKAVEYRRGEGAVDHDYNAVMTAPTCTEVGYTTHTCSRCGDTYTDSKTDALGHKPGTEADCLNDQICTVCGVVLIEKLGHDYKAVVTDPTCTEKGYTTHICSRCDDTYIDNETEALGHKPGTEADCLNNQICTACGEVLVGKLGHDYMAIVTAPTCTEKGYTTHTCSCCSDAYTDSKTDALGHTPGAEADCLNDQICTVCGVVLTEKLGHDYKAVVTDPTCTTDGYTTHTCSRCGDDYTDSETEALGHKPGDWIVDQEPAPGVEGSKHTACTVCGETLETAVIEALPVETESETQPVTDPEPDTETEPVTTVPTDAGEETTTAGETEKAPSGGGCAGNIHGISILFLLGCAAMISAVKRKRETE